MRRRPSACCRAATGRTKDALPSCDAYLLMEVIHDWADEESVAILKAVRRAAPAGAKLLPIEAIVPDAAGPHW